MSHFRNFEEEVDEEDLEDLEDDEDDDVCQHGVSMDVDCDACDLEDFPDDETWVAPDPEFEADAHREQEALERLEAGLPACTGCGCTAVNPCLGGCVWATEARCSRCVG